MLQKKCNLRLLLASTSFCCCLLLPQASFGQVVPDGTTQTPDPGSCATICSITGGTQDVTGTNLFHSFDEFSVPDGGTVMFEHSPTIRNILTRITGSEVSMIDGFIKTITTADTNLFLLNPNGIVFGPNGGLDIGGSFVATTADAIQFDSQGVFSASDITDDLALLTINPSAFLFNQAISQPIISRSNVPSTGPFPPGLGVREGKSLVLLGGDVIIGSLEIGFFAGNIIAPSGRIELGGVNGPGVVGLDNSGNNQSLRFEDNASLANVFLNGSTLDISPSFFNGGGAGSIAINANNLSFINSNIRGVTFGSETSGDILLRAKDSASFQSSFISGISFGTGGGGNVEILANLISLDNRSGFLTSTLGTGNAGRILLVAETISLNNGNISSEALSFFEPTGDAGEIRIKTDRLSLAGRSTISTKTDGAALNAEASGLLNIEAQDQVSLVDESRIISETLGERNASTIAISARELIVQDLARISAITSGEGDAGNILVREAELVSFTGSVVVSTETSTIGRGGNIDIDTQSLIAQDGARVSATALPTALPTTQGGSVTVNANTIDLSGQGTGLFAETQGPATGGLVTLAPSASSESLTINFQDGAEISAATRGSGPGGNIEARASEAITINGNGSLTARSTASGPAVGILIDTGGRFAVENGARVEVSSEGTGDSGTLGVVAGLVVLDNGQLLASTQAGAGGNIDLTQIQDALILTNDSLISAEAFNDANGGNIDIGTQFIIALIPNGPNGSDIQASAQNGNGGLITIQTNSILGLQENIAMPGNRTNDIDASSGAGIDGEVIINTLDLDPNQGITNLPANQADPIISEGCQASGNSNGQFINSGRGGLTTNPYDPLSNDGIQDDIYPAGQPIAQYNNPAPTIRTNAPPEEDLVEANGWGRTSQGDIVLMAAAPTHQSLCNRTFLGGH